MNCYWAGATPKGYPYKMPMLMCFWGSLVTTMPSESRGLIYGPYASMQHALKPLMRAVTNRDRPNVHNNIRIAKFRLSRGRQIIRPGRGIVVGSTCTSECKQYHRKPKKSTPIRHEPVLHLGFMYPRNYTKASEAISTSTRAA